jgi:hypothetical protein
MELDSLAASRPGAEVPEEREDCALAAATEKIAAIPMMMIRRPSGIERKGDIGRPQK